MGVFKLKLDEKGAVAAGIGGNDLCGEVGNLTILTDKGTT
jgi:hypothetical protein